ncbi:hypothetical protein K432DRAFT_462897 [Lepidopterella palustris CBS 459.81]|uniref:Uncharacterized protein n=1 Tax=Lepidopterella palustris CBS 459.81 TaxID=1314670 RepID=A0A8E2E363_9PEZI|nr:hypothetical protein K432DRAFT_462897 [Lepidopterella palustris CBS 459.81]
MTKVARSWCRTKRLRVDIIQDKGRLVAGLEYRHFTIIYSVKSDEYPLEGMIPESSAPEYGNSARQTALSGLTFADATKRNITNYFAAIPQLHLNIKRGQLFLSKIYIHRRIGTVINHGAKASRVLCLSILEILSSLILSFFSGPYCILFNHYFSLDGYYYSGLDSNLAHLKFPNTNSTSPAAVDNTVPTTAVDHAVGEAPYLSDSSSGFADQVIEGESSDSSTSRPSPMRPSPKATAARERSVYLFVAIKTSEAERDYFYFSPTPKSPLTPPMPLFPHELQKAAQSQRQNEKKYKCPVNGCKFSPVGFADHKDLKCHEEDVHKKGTATRLYCPYESCKYALGGQENRLLER